MGHLAKARSVQKSIVIDRNHPWKKQLVQDVPTIQAGTTKETYQSMLTLT